MHLLELYLVENSNERHYVELWLDVPTLFSLMSQQVP